MTKLSIIVTLFISVFVLQGIADAASISTRVRILESKTSKQDRQIKQQLKEQKSLKVRVDKGLQEIDDLKSQVEKFMMESQVVKSAPKMGEGDYSYP
ncbi:MAG TPA: hypothetical protein DD716_06310 [Thiomicrospira sp.]|jgi:cell division protein FtsL|nr:hypothetical protein [Thiomicrospira sp.]